MRVRTSSAGILIFAAACASQQSPKTHASTSDHGSQAGPTPTYMAPVSTASPTSADTGQPVSESPDQKVSTDQQQAGGAPSVQIGEPSTSGQIANATELTLGMQNDFVSCYEQGIAADAKTSGTLLVALQIGKDGAVTRADASPIGNVPSSVQSCIRARAEKAKFSAPKGNPAIVSFSVTLTRTSESATQTARAGTSNELKEVAVSPPGFEHADRVAQFVRAKARECYRDALRTEPRAEGNVAVALWLDGKGVVDKVEALRTGTLSDTLTQCIKKRSARAHFPAPKIAPTVVTVPIRLALKPAK